MSEKQLRTGWILFGLGSAAAAFLVPYVGWYTLGNLLVLIAGFFVLRLASARSKRLVENAALLKKMNRRQKDQLLKMDAQEGRSIKAMIDVMMPTLTLANAAINVYTYLYYHAKHMPMSPMKGLSMMPDWDSVMLLVIDVLCAVGMYMFLRKDIYKIMREPEALKSK